MGLARSVWTKSKRRLNGSKQGGWQMGTGMGLELTLEPRATLNLEMPTEMAKLVASIERNLIKAALELANGSNTRAAALLGIKRPTLMYKIKMLGIEQTK
jgi:DNA-binding NtrC family response regulator